MEYTVSTRRIKILERRKAFLEKRCVDHKGGDWDREEIGALSEAIRLMKGFEDGQISRVRN